MEIWLSASIWIPIWTLGETECKSAQLLLLWGHTQSGANESFLLAMMPVTICVVRNVLLELESILRNSNGDMEEEGLRTLPGIFLQALTAE